MGDREPVTADDLDGAVGLVVGTLSTVVDRDWTVPAGSLEWSCAHTAEHLGDCLIAYASQLAAQAADHYVKFVTRADPVPAHLLEFIRAGGRLLVTMVEASPPQTRAFHPYGVSDPEGFAAMGCVETLIHGHDLAAGLGVELAAPGEVCARVLARLFPEQASELADVDPWQALRYVTGRTGLPERPAVTSWRWRGTPLDR